MTETPTTPAEPPPTVSDRPEGSAPPELPAARPSRRRRIAAAALSVLGVVAVVAIVAGFLVRLPYVIVSPGSATPLDANVISVSGAQTYPHDGELLFLTVRVTNQDPNAWRVLVAALDPDVDLEDRADVVGCLTPVENTTVNTLLMNESQDTAKRVALTRLGYTVQTQPAPVVVTEACPGAPAHGTLAVGDHIDAVDGTAVSTPADVVNLVRERRPGDAIKVTIEREGANSTESVRAGVVSADGTECRALRGSAAPNAGTTCLGVRAQAFPTYTFPVDVTIDTQQVGGPSAGLAFALAIVDELTPGGVTGGARVAVTGAIDSEGNVLPVGGVEQKAITARRNGSRLMLVPHEELAAARKKADGLRVVGVRTLDEALDALAAAGGTPVPPPSSTSARSLDA